MFLSLFLPISEVVFFPQFQCATTLVLHNTIQHMKHTDPLVLLWAFFCPFLRVFFFVPVVTVFTTLSDQWHPAVWSVHFEQWWRVTGHLVGRVQYSCTYSNGSWLMESDQDDDSSLTDPCKELNEYLDGKLVPRTVCADIIAWWGVDSAVLLLILVTA